MEDELTVVVLRMALESRHLAPGWVHHSDRGGQYASGHYPQLLKAHGCTISMSRKGNLAENDGCGSGVKTLNEEPGSVSATNRQQYRDLAEARAAIAEFIEKVYNRKVDSRRGAAAQELDGAALISWRAVQAVQLGPVPVYVVNNTYSML